LPVRCGRGLAMTAERDPSAAWPEYQGECGVIPADKQATPDGESTMFSITLKRSAATLGVVAGLLAAAAPASAAVGVRDNGSQGVVKTPVSADRQINDSAVVVLIGAND